MIVTGYQARTLLGLSAWTGRKVFQQPVNGTVVSLCIRTDLNAKAPTEFLCGVGPVRVKAGNLLASTMAKLPVFTKTNVNQWEYQGLFRVAASHRSGPRFDAMVADSGRSIRSVSVAIELTE